jgi:flagellar biosynthesis GTPase FlhF
VPCLPVELLDALAKGPPESPATLPAIQAGSPFMAQQPESDEEEHEDVQTLARVEYAHNLQSRRRPQQQRKLFWAEDTDLDESEAEDDALERSQSQPDFAAGHARTPVEARTAALAQDELSARNRSRSEPSIPGMERARSGSILKRDSFKSKADVVVAVVGPKGVGKSTVVAKLVKKAKPRASIVASDQAGNQGRLARTLTFWHSLPRQSRLI